AADAQSIILAELERQFGGSAKAAADGLGGSLKQLSNAFGDLFEANEAGIPSTVSAIQGLTAQLQDPQTVEGAQRITAAIVKLLGLSVDAAVGLANYATAYGELAGRITVNIQQTEGF